MIPKEGIAQNFNLIFYKAIYIYKNVFLQT